MTRLFVGIELPENAKDRLLAIGRGVPGARWQNREQLHLTLRFIGDADGPLVEDIRGALAGVHIQPFEIAITGVGLFGKITKPRILWAGVEPRQPAIELHGRIDKALAGIGLSSEARKYSPHVTLARFKSAKPGPIRDFLESNDALQIPGIEVTGFALFSSFLSQSGAIYRIEETYPL